MAARARLAHPSGRGGVAVHRVVIMKFTYIPLAAIGLAIACTPVINERGYLGDPQIESSLKPGSDSKTSVTTDSAWSSGLSRFRAWSSAGPMVSGR